MKVVTFWFAMWLVGVPRYLMAEQSVPVSKQCQMQPDGQNLWWVNTKDKPGENSCELFYGHESTQDCGICLRFDEQNKQTVSRCYHFRLMWKYDFRPDSVQICLRMDYCNYSFHVQEDELAKICGVTRLNEKGMCESVYGTYICHCHDKSNQGKDCTEVGPEGAYASGVQVLINEKVQVSKKFSIFIAARSAGTKFKVHITLPFKEHVIQITEPIATDPSSEKLIQLCKVFTIIKDDCKQFLTGSTTMYGIDLRFPLKRGEGGIYQYLHKPYSDSLAFPYGYYVRLKIITTNLVDNVEKVSFYRKPTDDEYELFVEYPIYINCYKKVKIDSCEDLKKKVNVYHASEEITLSATVGEVDNNEDLGWPVKPDCETSGQESTKWILSQIMPNGTFRLVHNAQGEHKFTFTIPAYKFKNGIFHLDFTYKMIASGGNVKEARDNFDECYVTVVEEPLIAIIDGGSSVFIDVESVLILDGRRSYDPNLPGDEGKKGLQFMWTCTTDQGKKTCLESDLSKFKTKSHLYLNPFTFLEGQEYVITLEVKKNGKEMAYAKQKIVTGKQGIIRKLDVKCTNCFGANVANPMDYIYLEVYPILRRNKTLDSNLNFNWTYSSYPALTTNSTESIREHSTIATRLKIGKNKLEQNKTYEFCVFVDRTDPVVQACITIHTKQMENFTCTITPLFGITAKTNFSLNCSQITGLLVYEVYDKSLTDPDYFTGRMLFTGLNLSENYFKLSNENLVVYGYNQFKMVQEWNCLVNLTPFDGHPKDVDEMIHSLNRLKGYPQSLLNSASLVPVVIKYETMDWQTVIYNLISTIFNVNMEAWMYTKLILSSIDYIFFTYNKNINLSLEVEEAKMCADIMFKVASSLSERVKYFEKEATLTDIILQQMDRSILNVIETVLTVRNSKKFTKPLHLVNPNTLRTLKETSVRVVNSLYIIGKIILWRQIEGENFTEIVSSSSKISQWVIVHSPIVLNSLRRQNQEVLFSFSVGLYKTIKSLNTLGIQVTNIIEDPFWWAGGDINTNILLIQLCFKVNPTQCKDQRVVFKAPMYLYYNITENVNELKPVHLHAVYFNLTNGSHDLDLDVTVYRFDVPVRAKLFYKFKIESSDDEFKFIFKINKRPDFKTIMYEGFTINGGNKSSLLGLPYKKLETDNLYYLGIVPIKKGKIGSKLKFEISIFYVVCKTWLTWKWGTERCWVGEEETNTRTLRCDCNHLSMFAGTVKVPHYVLNPAMEFLLFLTEEFNWLPLLVLIIVLLVFIPLFIWGYFKDRKDAKKGIVIILEDNYPGERFGYLIGVFTGSRINAGTDANIGVKLFGENDESRAHILKSTFQPTLRANSDDWFLLYCPENLGILHRLQIWHDNSGNSPDWFVEKIEVYDLTEKVQYIFELNIWLAFELEEYPDAIIAPSSMADFYSVKRVFLDNVITGFRDTHYWTSVLWKHPRNPINRTYRLSVLLFYIMVAMIATIIVYRFNKGDYKEDEPSFSINYTDLIIFALTLIVASFLSCLVMFLFRKSFSHKEIRQQSSVFFRPDDMKRRSNFLLRNDEGNVSEPNDLKTFSRLSKFSLYELTTPKYIDLNKTNLDERFIRFGPRSKQRRERSTYENFAAALHAVVRGNSLEPVRLTKYSKSVVLHRSYFFTVWILCVAIVLSSVLVVIIFGYQIPKVLSNRWLVVFISVILFDAFILSTLKIFLCSLILSCVFQRTVAASNYQLKGSDGIQKKLIGNLDHLLKLLKIRSHPMYCPLSGKAKELFREERIRDKKWMNLVEFTVVILFVLVLVMLTAFTEDIYGSNIHAARMMTQIHSMKYPNFTSIYNRTHYTEFFANSFIEQLYRYLWYNQEDSLNDNKHMRRNSWTYDCTMRLLGNARIRQLRVILGECTKIKYFEYMNEYCSPPWSSRAEDTGTYGSNWDIGSYEDTTRKITAWRYTDASLSNSSVTYGSTRILYSAGGYIEDLGYEQDETAYVLSLLFPLQWLDHMTRAVFVELTLYNVNTGLFSQVVLVTEQTPTGEYLVTVKAESVTTDFSLDIWNVSYGVFLIFFLVRMCVLMNRKGTFIYFSRVINVFEVFLLGLGILALIFYVIHIKTSSEYAEEFQRSGIDKFFSFSVIIYYNYLSRIAMFILFVCVIIRMLVSWHFGRIYLTFYYTIFLSLPWAMFLVLLFSLYLGILWRFVGYFLNIFIFSYYTTAILYYKDCIIKTNDNISFKLLIFVLCLLSYVIILLFIASFAYYYKISKSYRIVNSEMYNLFTFLKETLRTRILKKNKKY